MFASVRSQPRNRSRPLAVLVHRDLPDELFVPGVALAGLLVEGLLADHVGDREQEQLGLGVPGVPGRALVVVPVAPVSVTIGPAAEDRVSRTC
jgi:hypothetical protein